MSSSVQGLGLIPRSEWLFAKLYCSPSHADRLLLELVQPLVENVFEAGIADRWFFTRYADPQWHLRLRFHGDGAVLRNRVVPELSRRAEEHERLGTLWRLQWDEYEREVERYGGQNGIGIAERFFQLDSELCLGLLALASGDTRAELRWQLAFCGVHHVLDALGFSLKEKKVLAANMREFREREFLRGTTYRRQLARKFRDERQTLTAILQDADEIVQPPTVLPREAVAAFARFSAGLRAIRKQLQDAADSGALTKTIPELTADFVHMHLNRMLRSSHHVQETVIYDFLTRTYAAKIVKEKSTQ